MDAPAELRLFGPPALAGGPVLARNRRHQLLVFLAISARAVDRDRLAGLFWPEHGNDEARRNLRKMLYDLRALPWLAACPLRSDAISIAWPLPTDLQRFDAAHGAAAWAQAVQIGTAPLAEGLEGGSPDFDEWLQRERAHVRGRWRQALLRALAADAAGDEALDAAAQRALQHDALDEEMVYAHLRWLLRHRGAPRARRGYDAWVLAVQQALGLPPTLSWDQLTAEVVRAAPPASPMPARRAAPAPPLSRFFGRQRELAELQRHLQLEGCRLVTLLGPPGVGKTRLAQQYLAAQAEPPVFVALDELSPHPVPASEAGTLALVAALAAALGSGLPDAHDAPSALLARLRRGAPLLVLDSFEHRLGDLPFLQRLLMETRATVLVTSRTRLGLPGEQVLALDGLAGGEDGDALQLLLDRAGITMPLGETALAAARRLCRLAGGQPLAIEIAAGSCRHLGLAEVARRFEDRIDALAAEPATPHAPPRQRSLAAAFDTSWRLLAAPLQEVLARLSVLGGDFSPTLAQVVVGQPAGTVERALADLADASLLRQLPDSGRFAWHPFARELAAQRLALAPLQAELTARRALCRHVVETLERQGPVEVRPEPEALSWVARELAHVRAAWLQALAEGLYTGWEPLAEALAMHYEVQARYREGAALLALAQAHAAQAPPRIVARVALLCARLQHWLDSETARRTALAARQVFDHHDDVPGRVACGRLLGVIAWRQGDSEGAVREFQAALQAGETAGHEAHRAILLDGLGLALAHLGRSDEAMDCFHQALALNQRHGNPYQLVQNLINLSLGERQRSPGDALPLAQRALELAQQIGYQHYLPHGLGTLARAHLALGDVEAALQRARQASELARQSGDAYIESWALQTCALAGLQQGQVAQAREDLRRGLDVAWATHDIPLVLRHLLITGRLAAAGDDPAWARHLLAQVAAHPRLPRWLQGEVQELQGRLGLQDTGAVHDGELATLVQAALGWLGPSP